MRQREVMAILEDRAKRNKRPRNPDPEAKIEQIIHELAYERVKNSYLFNQFGNAMLDKKADELAGEVAQLVEDWIVKEVNAAP